MSWDKRGEPVEAIPLYTGFKPLEGDTDLRVVHNELVVAINKLHERVTELEKHSWAGWPYDPQS